MGLKVALTKRGMGNGANLSGARGAPLPGHIGRPSHTRRSWAVAHLPNVTHAQISVARQSDWERYAPASYSPFSFLIPKIPESISSMTIQSQVYDSRINEDLTHYLDCSFLPQILV